MLSWDLRRQVSSAPKNAFTMPSKMSLDRVASARPRPQNSPVRCLPPYQPIFPKILQKPRKCATLFLTNAIRARGPAAARHFATNENRLPILPISPNHAERTAALPAQLCRIRPLAELPPKPFFRTSQIVSDRLRSSEIVRAHRRPSPAIPAELPKGSPDSVRQTGKKARQNASFRGKISPGAPEATLSARSARTIPKFDQPGTTEFARRQSRNGHQRPPEAPRHPWEETFFRGDIGRHWGTLGDLCPPRAPSAARERAAGRAPQICPCPQPHRHPPRPERKPAAQLEHLAVHPRQQPIVPRRLQRRLRHAHPVRHSPLPKVEVHEMLRSCAEIERAPCWNGFCSWSILYAERTTRQWRKSTRCDKDVGR